MKKTLLATMMLLCMAISAHALPVYEGMLSTTSGVLGTGIWANNFKFAWHVELQATAWWYQYRLTELDGSPLDPGAVSHWVVEISPDATRNDFWGFNGEPIEFGSFRGITNAMKMDFGASSQIEWSFYSLREPTWGDFWAKDGKAGGQGLNTAWNAGFTAPDPLNAPANGSIDNKILRPDTTVIPEPGTLGLLGAGVLGLGLRLRRRLRK